MKRALVIAACVLLAASAHAQDQVQERPDQSVIDQALREGYAGTRPATRPPASEIRPLAAPEWKHRLSADCAEQIMQHQATAYCEEQGRLWSEEVTQKTQDPSWRQKMIEWAEKNHACVSASGCQ
jgi:hypothetical protein